MSNPFFDRLDWSLQGTYARVYGQNRVYDGWVNVMHHNRGSVLLHNAEEVLYDGDRETDRRPLGTVFVRVAEAIEEKTPSKRIEELHVQLVVDSQFLDFDYTPKDYHMRRAYRNGFAGSFPVVRPIYNDDELEHYELINGHKRVEAMRRVGLEKHPFEIIDVDDDTAKELFYLAHRDAEHTATADEPDSEQADLTSVVRKHNPDDDTDSA